MSTMAIVKGAISGLPRMIKSTAVIGGVAIKKHAPTILLVTGIAATVAGTVVACKKTLEMPEIIDEVKAKSKDINGAVDVMKVTSPATGETRLYTNEDAKQDLTKVYISTAGKVLKLYWLPTILIGGGIAMVCVSHGVLNKRLLAATAAYEGISQAFDRYRKRVIEAEGIEKDREYFCSPKEDDEVHHVSNKKKKDIPKPDPNNPNRRIYDEVSSKFWSPIPIYNLTKVKEAKSLAWIRMKHRYNDTGIGFVYLWEVELELGLIPTSASFTEGWLYNPNFGDEQISFGLEHGGPGYENKVDFLTGKACNVCLEFNTTNISDILTNSDMTDTYMERMNY